MDFLLAIQALLLATAPRRLAHYRSVQTHLDKPMTHTLNRRDTDIQRGGNIRVEPTAPRLIEIGFNALQSL